DEELPFYACTAEAWVGHPFASRDEWTQTFRAGKPWENKEHGWTVAAASFPFDRSPYGIRHLGGNVWEWCEDWYHQATYRMAGGDRNPRGPPGGTDRVARGGSWLGSLLEARTAARHHIDPKGPFARNYTTGFRCVRDP
ncbi:MAG TPA: SUMF1/EgtB/PvdO family nonheme iron enzyme, partial [Planctomycetota bacterium]|nr:SUMF1/EgtB/PvdO family nonheme iron enzyme [Planctomycetota bacterium]